MADEMNKEGENFSVESSADLAPEGAKINDVRTMKKGKKRTGIVFLILSAITFGVFLFFTIPLLNIFFHPTAQDLGEALGEAFGLVMLIVMMFLVGIPHLIFSLVSSILFGTSIGKTDKPEKTKVIILFAVSLALLLAAVLIAVISIIVIKSA